MPYSLPSLARAAGKRRNVLLRPIIPTDAQAIDLAAIIAPAWRIWAENIDRIMAGYNPAPLPVADALVLDSPDQITAAIESVANEFLTRLVTTITPGLRAWVVRAERIHRSKWAAAIKAGAGVDIEMVLQADAAQETLGAFMARNVALVRNISDQAQGRISDAVFRGYQNRTPPREVAKEIREATGMGRTRAIGIAADQNSKLSAALDKERQAEAGIELVKWRHSGKLHPRQNHKAREGNLYQLRSGKIVRGEGGDLSPDQRAGVQPWCGCREQAYIALLEEIE
jgi:hypothetical protein